MEFNSITKPRKIVEYFVVKVHSGHQINHGENQSKTDSSNTWLLCTAFNQ